MQQNPLLVVVEDDKIMQIDYAGRPVKEIGRTTAQYTEALKVIDGYKQKLIEAGIIQKEKTPAELQAETNAMIQTLISKVQELEEKVNKDENGHVSTADKDANPPRKAATI